MLYQKPANHVLNFHLDILNLPIRNELLVESFVTLQCPIFQCPVLHELLGWDFALSLQLEAIARQFLLGRTLALNLLLYLTEMKKVTLQSFQSLLVALSGSAVLVQEIQSAILR